MPDTTPRGFGRQPAAASAADGHNYLLAIGIDAYTRCPPLNNAVSDARAVVDTLTTRYHFDPDRTTTLYDEAATEQQIMQAFRQLRRTLTPEDNLVIYFSGHGEYDDDFEIGYWVPVNADPGAFDQYIAESDLRNVLNKLPAKHIFLIADSCFSGTLFANYRSTGGSIERLERDPSRWGLTAGRKELVQDGPKGTQSPFAAGLLYQLKNHVKPLSVSELCHRVVESVTARAEQTPRGEPLRVNGHQGGQFVFHPRRDEAESWALTRERHTTQAYHAFLKIFPAGAHAAEAQAALRKLGEDAGWAEARQTDTVAAYQTYLTEYPQGKYLTEALRLLRARTESRDWQRALTADSLEGFLSFQIQHPTARQAEVADHLARVRAQQVEVQRLTEEHRRLRLDAAQRQAQQREAQAAYTAHLTAADTQLREKRYAEAAGRYQEAIESFQPGLTPTLDYPTERLQHSLDKANQVTLFNDGRRAYEAKNYALALQYFEQARAAKADPALDKWIRASRQALQAPSAPAATVGTARPRNKKKGLPAWLIVGGVIVGLLGALAVIGLVAEELETDDYDYSSTYVPETLDAGAVSTGTAVDPALLGRWRVTDIQSGGVSLAATGLLPLIHYQFTADETLEIMNPMGTTVYRLGAHQGDLQTQDSWGNPHFDGRYRVDGNANLTLDGLANGERTLVYLSRE